MSTETEARSARRESVRAFKRESILEAAGAVFAERGLDGATIRAIAERAGYTPGAIYLHFDGKEAIYAELLGASLDRLARAVKTAAGTPPPDRARRILRVFYEHYAAHPAELELGLYLYQGARPRGLSSDLDRQLNQRLIDVLDNMAAALAEATGEDPAAAKHRTVSLAAHTVGCLIMESTGRLRVLGHSAAQLVDERLDELLGPARGPGVPANGSTS